MKLTLTITDGIGADFEKTEFFSEPDPKRMDELFCAAYAHMKVNTPKEVEIIGETCTSCEA